MKVRVTYITGEAPNLPWWRALSMTAEEIRAYNKGFFKYETVEYEDDTSFADHRATAAHNKGA